MTDPRDMTDAELAAAIRSRPWRNKPAAPAAPTEPAPTPELVSTSSTHTPPAAVARPGKETVLEMPDAEFDQAVRTRAWR